jgi:hypothetical protein
MENKFYLEGYEEGLFAGKEKGLLEGQTLGYKKGFEIWDELGFYFQVLTLMLQEEENIDIKVVFKIKSLMDTISDFPRQNKVGAPLMENLVKIRTQFKFITSKVGLFSGWDDKMDLNLSW